MRAEPIAIIGRGCVLPACHTPEMLWQAVANKKSLITPPPPGTWGLTPTERPAYSGGYITEFSKVFDPDIYDLGDIDAVELDPVFQWSLKAASDAWTESGQAAVRPDRMAVILANLSYPSRAKADHAGDIWLHGASDILPVNALNSSRPAHLIARTLGATGPAFSLDAACASSLYAIHIACRKLRMRTIDIAVAAAVNAADNLMLHRGFEALQALSPTGRSQPFASSADGLVPSEGAAAIVLKRLSDVEPDETVFGLIRGTGLSNDGRRRGLLAPDETGQVEAMQRAYAAAGTSPDSIGYLECHATGTPVGDGIEVASAAKLYGSRDPLPVGSLKSNMGHLITVAGMASLLKMLEAFRHNILPPTRLEGDVIPAFADTALTPQLRAAPWHAKGPRRAGISNFGFGGNNAHLILEDARLAPRKTAVQVKQPEAGTDIAICGIGTLAGADRGTARLIRRLMSPPKDRIGRCETLHLNPGFARVPPGDLARAEAQQIAILDTCADALNGVDLPEPDRVGVFAAMECASDSARWLLRERLASRLNGHLTSSQLSHLRDDITAPITSADVLGAMPNMPANRLNTACDFRGQGFTVSAAERSGEAALQLAIEALLASEIDMAIVAAADFATEPVRASVLAELGLTTTPADLACTLILKRSSDASSENIFAILPQGNNVETDADTAALVARVYGCAPVADQLFHLAAASLLAKTGQRASDTRAIPWLCNDERKLPGLTFPAACPAPDPLRPPPHLFWAAANSPAALIKKIKTRRTGGEGNIRLAILAQNEQQLADLLDASVSALRAGRIPEGDGIYAGKDAPEGELAFVFTGSAAAYPRMGRHLFMGFPDLAADTVSAFPEAARLAPLLAKPDLSAYEQLCAVTLLSQSQTLLLRNTLGLEPDAAIGLSLGETNALIAFKFWNDAGHLLDEISADAMYEHYLGGAFETAREAWGCDGPAQWTNWRIYAPLERVREALSATENVEITIIYSPEDCVIGGPPDACRTVANALGKRAGIVMNQHLIVHAEAMAPYADTWRMLHTRPTSRKPTIRIYSNAINAAYRPAKTKTADMLTRQAVSTVDFPATVEQAYTDGVRAFVEIGPRDSLTLSIEKILGERPHLAVATDRIETSNLEQIARAAAALFADGRDINLAPVANALEAARTSTLSSPPPAPEPFRKPAHAKPPKIDRPTMTKRSSMPPAPTLAPPDFGKAPSAPEAAAVALPESVQSGKIPLRLRQVKGPAFNREALEAATTGPISTLFGEAFEAQDHYARQVRLPAPPLLLVDRITGIDAVPTVEGKGVIWTETDVTESAWYMHDGFMRPGPLIEAGQADLSLISWMGADLQNRDERVYRLLGCELTLHDGGLPRAGDRLKYQIEITGHATLNGVRMFFFQYDCYTNGRRLFSVRNGQAGFFTDAELAAGKGVLWDASTEGPPTALPAPFQPDRVTQKRCFGMEDLTRFRDGDAFACFGEGFERCAPHSNPPRSPDGKLNLIDHIPVFDPEGGPWGRGYLKAATHVPDNAWFYDGHFHNDPCMPGTLMAEAAVQALEFYAAAVGLTINCDGFIFEPVTEEAFKFICRGQIIPDGDHDLTYEIFIDEIIDGDTPVLFAALLATSDGKKVFYCPRFGVQLRRNWPIVPQDVDKTAIGPMGESRGDWAALKACGDGAPSDAFGDMYTPFDMSGRVPRLPQPPYHFVSRVLSISTRPNDPQEGATVVTEYDIPEDAWYFDANRNGAMPFAILVEIVLQPCGWLASHGGFALNGGECFRNLDGEGTVFRDVGPTDGLIRVESVMTRFSRAGPMTIVFFEVTATLASGEVVMQLETSFGFFPHEALARQAGLKVEDTHRAQIAPPSASYTVEDPDTLLPFGQMEMLDRVDHFDPTGGASELGLIRGQQDINPYAWYFKAHFYQDPVQPGSLGLDALVQLLKRAVLLKGLADDMEDPRFQSVATNQLVKWSYRGQVTPENTRVTTVMEITDIKEEDDGYLISAAGSLWCDGLRIYEAGHLSIRLLSRA